MTVAGHFWVIGFPRDPYGFFRWTSEDFWSRLLAKISVFVIVVRLTGKQIAAMIVDSIPHSLKNSHR